MWLIPIVPPPSILRTITLLSSVLLLPFSLQLSTFIFTHVGDEIMIVNDVIVVSENTAFVSSDNRYLKIFFAAFDCATVLKNRFCPSDLDIFPFPRASSPRLLKTLHGAYAPEIAAFDPPWKSSPKSISRRLYSVRIRPALLLFATVLNKYQRALFGAYLITF